MFLLRKKKPKLSESPLSPKTPRTPRQQREVFRRFEVQKQLGKGSYGVVYRVRRLSDGRIYALKQADVTKMNSTERADAVNEIRIMASIRHPNIIRYHEAFLDGDYLCIVMEYAPHGDLARFIKKGAAIRKPLPNEIVWKYLIQVCQGLQALHLANIIHRDVKPMNLFVFDGDIVKLGDLGIAKMVGDSSVLAKTQIGTPHYMPPELWLSRPYTFSSDLWSLGCLLHELMTYKVPFEAKNVSELRQRVLSGAYKPVDNPEYSPELIDLARQLLAADASKRPSLHVLLSSPAMLTRLAGMPGFDTAVRRRKTILDTIKVPSDLRLLHTRLPPAVYGDGADSEDDDVIRAVREGDDLILDDPVRGRTSDDIIPPAMTPKADDVIRAVTMGDAHRGGVDSSLVDGMKAISFSGAGSASMAP